MTTAELLTQYEAIESITGRPRLVSESPFIPHVSKSLPRIQLADLCMWREYVRAWLHERGVGFMTCRQEDDHKQVWTYAAYTPFGVRFAMGEDWDGLLLAAVKAVGGAV